MQPSTIHEDILRHLWNKRYFRRGELATADGRTLRVIEPGVLNRESGPDFLNAVIVIGDKHYRGDVEFHRTFEDWKAHTHSLDPRYNSLILHVVLYGGGTSDSVHVQSGRSIPLLVLDGFLSGSLDSILEHTVRDEIVSRLGPIPCYQKNQQIDGSLIRSWIQLLYLFRLTEKVRRMKHRLCEIARDASFIVSEPRSSHARLEEIPPSDWIEREEIAKRPPWEQLLYEGLMDGLGYSKNRESFIRLARAVTLLRLKTLSRKMKLSSLEIRAILFQEAGLIPQPESVVDQQSKVYLHQLRLVWKNIAKIFPQPPEEFHAADWIFAPTRPSNFPTIRIAAAGTLADKILSGALMKRSISLVGEGRHSPHETLTKLLSLLEVPEDPFWSFHYSFADAHIRRHSLLGTARKHDIIINTLIPFCCLYAQIFAQSAIQEGAIAVSAVIPLLEDNSITRKIRKQLFKGKIEYCSALEQQGAVHLYKRFCSGSRCTDCDVGKIVFSADP